MDADRPRNPRERAFKVEDGLKSLVDQLREAERRLRAGGPDDAELWYRGVPNVDFALQPFLFRTPLGRSVERKLYDSFVELRGSGRDWDSLFEMQHYFVPTRLLDWSSSLGVALHFALGDEALLNRPTIWVLNPARLNRCAFENLFRQVKTGSLSLSPDFNEERFSRPLTRGDLDKLALRYCDHYLGRSPLAQTLAAVPQAAFDRLKAQRGRFTIHGVGAEQASLEELCPEALEMVVLEHKSIREIREDAEFVGIDPYSIYPDMVGLAMYLRQKFELNAVVSTKSVTAKLRQIWEKDIEILKKPLDERNGAKTENAGVEQCVIGDRCLYRWEDKYGPLMGWLKEGVGGLRTVTGSAGSGKTNYVLSVVTSEEIFSQDRVVIWFPLFCFDPALRLDGSIARYLEALLKERGRDLKPAVKELLRRPNTILVLDGLDELSRTQGAPAAAALANEVLKACDRQGVAQIIVTCRDDILGTLFEEGTRPEDGIKLADYPLREDEVRGALARRGVEQPEDLAPSIMKFPFFLPAIRREHATPLKELRKKLARKDYKADWPNILKALIRGNVEDSMKLLGEVALRMLIRRRDFLEASQEEFWSLEGAKAFASGDRSEGLRSLLAQKFKAQDWPITPLLDEKITGNIRFCHNMVREFVLAWHVRSFLASPSNSQFIGETSDLDYAGNEVFRAVAAMEREDPASARWGRIREACEAKGNDWMRRNNLAFCAFEAAGMLGADGDERNDVIAWIEEVLNDDVTGRDDRYSFKTKYNAARCLERLHPKAPPGYWEWIADHYRFMASDDDKPRKGFAGVSAWHYIYAYAVRGFQQKDLVVRPGALAVLDGGNRAQPRSRMDEPFELKKRPADTLFDKTKELLDLRELHPNAEFLLVNLTHALIRWAPPDRTRLHDLLSHKRIAQHEHARRNLLLAAWYRGDDGVEVVRRPDPRSDTPATWVWINDPKDRTSAPKPFR